MADFWRSQDIIPCENPVILDLQKTLRPCPFCGGLAKFFVKHNHHADSSYLFLECQGCGCKSGDVYIGYGRISGIEPSPINPYPDGDPFVHINLAKRWNRRIDD